MLHNLLFQDARKPQNSKSLSILSFKTKANEIQSHEFQAVAGMIQEIWLDGAIQETYRRRNEFILVIKIILHIIM